MKKAFPITLLPLLLYAGMASAMEVASFRLPQDVESGIGPFGIVVQPASGEKMAPGVYAYHGKVAFGYPDYDVKVQVDCNSGLYKVVVLNPVPVVDDSGNLKKTGYEEFDLGWEPRPLSPEAREGLCR